MIAPVPLNRFEPVTAAKPPVPLNAIDPVAAIKPTGSGRGEALRFLLQFEPGQAVSARIEVRLPDGSFRAQLAGQELRMTLPSYVNAGDTLELIFVTHHPRPTFALREPPQAASAAALSAAGRLVAAMLPQPGAPAMLTAASSAAPLLAAVPADSAGLSASLQQTLAQSGLFYEAHQAEWVAGKYDLAQLRTEPQARPAQSAPQSPVVLADESAAARPAATDSAPAATAQRSEQVLPAQLPALVQQQLAALESGRIVLQLELWPRQWMQWEVEERAQHEAHEPVAPSTWYTRLRLELPQLGELNAALTLGGNGVQIKLDAANAASATLLQEHRAALQAALAAAGVLPGGIAIAYDEQP